MKLSTKIILILSIAVIILLLILRLKNPKKRKKTSKWQGIYQGKPMEPIDYDIYGNVQWISSSNTYTKVYYYLDDEVNMIWKLVEDPKINDLKKIEYVGNIPVQRNDVHLINGYIKNLNTKNEIFYDSLGKAYNVKLVRYNEKGEIKNLGLYPVRYIRPVNYSSPVYTLLENANYTSFYILKNYDIPKVIY